MKNYSKITGCILVTLMLANTACKKNFQEINTNPNTSQFALPQALLAPAITDVVTYNMSRSQRINNELMQVTVNMGDTEGKIFRYDVRPSEADYLWNNWYLQLSNFKDVYKGATQEASFSKTYQAISLICQSWVYSMITDTYGDAPYFDSNKAKEGIVRPAFNTQKDIYLDIFKQLEAANELLKTGTNVAPASDPIYAGSAANWRKFGNSLYLRLLLRVSGKAEISATAIAKIKDIVDTNSASYPLISTNAESAVLKWTGASPYVSPFATYRPADWYTPKLASFFVDNLNAWSDPRIQKWGTLYLGEYVGTPSGYAPGQTPEGKSTLPTSLQIEPLLGNILNYPEVQFMLAEAAAKGWITAKTGKAYYEEGVTNGITLWNYTPPANYLTFAKIKWDDTYTLSQKMELIHLQKYYALFFTDMEQWFEYRRTGYPVMPKGAGLLYGGVMPARLNYPVYLQAANGENYTKAVSIQGVDNITTQVWWQKP
jgi:hypothetical protein